MYYNMEENADVFIDWTNKTFHNNYVLIHKLGFGSFASVWLSFNKSDKQFYAIKVHNGNDYEAGIKETKIYEILQSKINKKFIVSMKEAFDEKINDKIYHCEVLELFGYSLYNVLEQYENGIPLKQVIDISIKILRCIYEFHKNNFIHGDIKPENILLNVYHKDIIKIIKNFDLEKCESPINFQPEEKTMDTKTDTTEDHITIKPESYNETTEENVEDVIVVEPETELKICDVGFTIINSKFKKHIQTCYYKSPELLLGIPYDQSVDIWAFGCLFYELLTGQILFDIDTNIIQSNDERYHLFMMTEKIGVIPISMIMSSPYKNIYFTYNLKKIKGVDDIDYENTIYDDIKNNKQITKKQRDIIYKIFGLIFTYDIKSRGSVVTIIDKFNELSKVC